MCGQCMISLQLREESDKSMRMGGGRMREKGTIGDMHVFDPTSGYHFKQWSFQQDLFIFFFFLFCVQLAPVTLRLVITGNHLPTTLRPKSPTADYFVQNRVV